MCVRYLGLFLLLAWLPDLLQAELPCSPPELPDGYFVPEKNTYPHGETLTYSCEADFKPVVEGWWATSKCQNGKWSHTPQCIDKNSCLPPTIPNGKLEEMATSQNGWYEENLNIRVTCEDGFSLKGNPRTARCQNGEWYLPVCERSRNTCDEPDQIPHAVIINQAPKEVYAHNSELQYECENGYTTGQPMNRRTITCNRGTWTSGPPCSKSCMLDPTEVNIRSPSPIPLEEGEEKYIPCNREGYLLHARCSGGRIQSTDCKSCMLDPTGLNIRLSSPIALEEGKEKYIPCNQEGYLLHARCSGGRIQRTDCERCMLDPTGLSIRSSSPITLEEGKVKSIPCIWDYYSLNAKCSGGRIQITRCCHRDDLRQGYCRIV